MAYVMTYNSLIESVKRWVIRENDDALLAELPRLIDSTERKVARSLKTLMSIKFATNNLTTNNPIVVKPNRWLETVSFEIATGIGSNTTVLLYDRTYEYIKAIYPDQTQTGVPKYFCDFEFDQFFVGPTPDTNYEFQIAYYERPEPLSEDNQTNWLTINAPDVMLYGVLLECAPFLIADEKVKMWQDMYDRKLAELIGEDARRLRTRTQVTKEA